MRKDYVLTIRAMAGFYLTRTLQGELTEAEAIEASKRETFGGRLQSCLRTPGGENIWLAKDGTVIERTPHGPRMKIGGQDVLMNAE